MYPGAHSPTTPDKPAVVMAETGASISYAELEQGSARLARALHDRGLRPGDVVALLSDNRPEVFFAYWAALRSGLYLTAINHHLTTDEAAYIVGDSGARVLISSSGLADLATAVAGRADGVEHAFSIGGDIAGHEPLEPLLAADVEPLAEQPRGNDMLYSSGTTGRPKGIKPSPSPLQIHELEPLVGLLTHMGRLDADTVYLSPAPIYHAAPLRWCAAVHASGGTVVMTERFDPEQALAVIEQHRVTTTQMVPTMFVRLLQLDDAVRAGHDVSSLQTVIHAAAPCPPEVKEAMIAWWGPILVEYYSSTEANGLTMISSPEWLEHRGSVGRAVLGTIHICDDDGAEVGVGEIGSVYFERDQVPFSYHNDPAKTAETTHPEHPTWTCVGDVGYVDDEGYLYLTDRKAFMIISGGVNIYPQEIENALALHPAVLDVAVIGVADAEMGQRVKAFVQPAAGQEPGEALAAEIQAYLRERIAGFKVPREIAFVDALPRTPTGKLVKGRLA